MKNVLFVDLCNTVANVNAELQKIGVETDHYPATFHSNEPINWLDLFAKAEPIEPVISLVNELSQDFLVIYLTSRPINSMEISLRWIQKHGLPQAPILHTRGRDKGKFVAHYGNRVVGMIEDSPIEIQAVLDVNPHLDLYIPDWSYNRQFQGNRIERETIPQQLLEERLKALYQAVGDLSMVWESLDHEQLRLLEEHYPFHQSFDDLRDEVGMWLDSVIKKSKIILKGDN